MQARHISTGLKLWSILSILALLLGSLAPLQAGAMGRPVGPRDPIGEAQLGDYVWHDRNGNGLQDDDQGDDLAGIDGVLVRLFLDDGDYQFNESLDTEITPSQTTDEDPQPNDQDGWYKYVGIFGNGNYYWVYVDPSNFAPGGPLEGMVLTSFVSGQVQTNRYGLILVQLNGPAPDYQDADFGYAYPGVTLEKTVYAGHDDGASCAGGEVVYGVDGAPVTYCFEITNSGETYLSPVELGDLDLGIDETDLTLLSGEVPLSPTLSLVYYYETSVTEELTNTATVTGTPSNSAGEPFPGNDVTDYDTARVEEVAPQIDLQKTVYKGWDGGDQCPGGKLVRGKIGEQITYCFEVTNLGDTYLDNLVITDPDLGIPPGSVTWKSGEPPLAPGGGKALYWYQATITGDITNTATVTGTPSFSNGNDIPDLEPVSDFDIAQVDEAAPGIEIQKTVYLGHNSGADCPAVGSEMVYGAAGAEVTYCFVVTNTNDVDVYLTNLVITDSLLSIPPGALIPIPTQSAPLPLAPETSRAYYYQSTIPVGGRLNTAEVEGTPTDSQGKDLGLEHPTDEDTAEVVEVAPDIEILKTVYAGQNMGASCPGVDLLYVDDGELVTYCFRVTNLGDTTLDNLVIDDYDLGIDEADLTPGSGSTPLAPGASAVYYYQTSVTQDLLNTVTVTGTPTFPTGQPIPGVEPPTDDDIAEVDEVAPGIVLTKTVYAGWSAGAGCATATDLVVGENGDPVTYCYKIKNSGDTYLNLILTDLTHSWSGVDFTTLPPAPSLPLAPGATITFYRQSNISGDLINTAEVLGQASNASGTPFPAVDPVSDRDTAEVQEVAPDIEILKTVYGGPYNNGAGCPAPGSELVYGEDGDPVTYCFRVRNTGDTYLNNIVITDPELSIPPNTVTKISGTIPLAPNAVALYYRQTTITKDLLNTATATGTPSDSSGTPLPGIDPPDDDDDARVEEVAPGIAITKTVYLGQDDGAGCPTAVNSVSGANNTQITYCFVIKNTGDTYLTQVTVDDLDLGITEAFLTPIGAVVNPLPPGGERHYYYESRITGDLQNTAVTEGIPSDEDGVPLPFLDQPSDEDDASVDQLPGAGIRLRKTVYAGHDGGAGCPGGELATGLLNADVTYCFVVENTGESQLWQITIKDLDLGIDETDMTPLQYPDGYLIDGILEPLEFVVFYYEGQISTNLINTALAQGTPYENNEPIGDPVQDDDAAEVRLVAQLGDWVWRDSDGDGRQDAGEIGVPGVTVRLYTSAGTFAGQTTTDASGYYSFTNLAAGSFYLVFSLPGGYAFSPQDVGADTQDSDPNPATGQTAPFTLTTGQSDLTRDAGLTPLATIGDYVWIDMNMDGIQGVSEAGLGGVTVNLYGPQGNLVDSTMTNASGYYEFTDVPPGDYYVDFGLPAGYGFTAQDQGADDGLDSDASPTNGQTSLFTVVDGQDDLTRDAGSIPLAAIGDRVWRDTDADGIQDAGESGYAGVTVRLYDELGNLVATTTTGATGIYQFTSIMPGSYYLEFVPPSGWVFSDAEQSANEELDSDPDPISGLTEVFTVGPGVTDNSWDAGVHEEADVTVTKTDNPDPVYPGSILVYTLRVENLGPSTARNVVVSDQLPPAVRFESANPLQTAGPNPLAWSLGDLAAGAVRTITVRVQVQSATPQTFINPVVVTSTTPDPNPDNNEDEEPTTLLVPAIDVVKAVDPSQAVPGQPIEYTITIENIGQVTLDPVTLTDTLPPNFQYLAGSGEPTEPDIVNEPTLVWLDLGSLDPNETMQVSFKVTALPGVLGQFDNLATATGDSPGGPVSDNDREPVRIVQPQVEVNKILTGADRDDEYPNYVTFTLVITNLGPTVINVLPLEDQYDPYYLTYMWADPVPDEPANDGRISWYDLTRAGSHGFNRNLGVGESFRVTIVFRVAHDIPTTTNVAIVNGARDIYDNVAPRTEDDEIISNVPTYIELLSFTASAPDNQVLLEWVTTLEINNMGFSLYRSATPDLAGASYIYFQPAAGIGQFDGASYHYRDAGVVPGRAYYYWLEDVAIYGETTLHGPVRVTIPYRVYLALTVGQ